MQFYSKRTVDEQASRLPEELQEAYRNSQIDRIKIFDGTTELEVTGYAEYSYLEEKSYKTQPVRMQDGAIEEIEEYETFLTPRLIIKYNMMGIDDYRSLMKMLKRRNSFIVECYDVVEDKIVKNEMYFATPSMPIIYQQYLMAIGIREYTIELIGTNTFSKIQFRIDENLYESNWGNNWRELAKSNPKTFEIKEFEGIPRVAYKYMGTVSYLLYPYTDKLDFVSPDDFIISDGFYYVLYQ